MPLPHPHPTPRHTHTHTHTHTGADTFSYVDLMLSKELLCERNIASPYCVVYHSINNTVMFCTISLGARKTECLLVLWPAAAVYGFEYFSVKGLWKQHILSLFLTIYVMGDQKVTRNNVFENEIGFLGTFTIFAKSDYLLCHVCPSVCSSVCPHWTIRLPQNGFSWNLIFEYFSKICQENWSFIKIWQE